MKNSSLKLSLCFGSLLVVFSCGQSTENKEDSEVVSTEIDSIETDKMMPEAIEFPSLDDLTISAVLWEVSADAETILLCHQAGSNYHEYDEIAPKLNELGYNCLAIDQRAGGILFDIVNQTADRAISNQLSVDYLDAQQDIEAGINYCVYRYKRPVILWGSSYSAGLALHLAENNEDVSAVIAFSPGDYFDSKKPPLKEVMTSFSKPYFITSSKHEVAKIEAFLPSEKQDEKHVQFKPEQDGQHGSKTLWNETVNSSEYWEALTLFLEKLHK